MEHGFSFTKVVLGVVTPFIFLLTSSQGLAKNSEEEAWFRISNNLHPSARFIGSHDTEARTLYIEHEGYSKIECSHDDGFNFRPCDDNGRKLIWTRADYESGLSVVIRFYKKDNTEEEYFFNPKKYNPIVQFRDCDEQLNKGGHFDLVAEAIKHLIDRSGDKKLTLCLGSGVEFSHYKDARQGPLFINKNITILGTQSGKPKLSNNNSLGETGILTIPAMQIVTLANLELSTAGLFGHAIIAEKQAYVALNNLDITTEDSISYGVFAKGAMVELDSSIIHTKGERSSALFAHQGANISSMKFSRLISHGPKAPAVYVQGSSRLYSLNSIIESMHSSADSHAILLDSGQIKFDDSLAESHGEKTPAIKLGNLGKNGSFSAHNSRITAHTDADIPAISYLKGGAVSLQNSQIANSGNGIEIVGDKNLQSLVMMDDNMFKLALDAKRGNKYVAVKSLNKDQIWLLSHKNNNSACRLGNISYESFVSGGYAEGSTIIPNEYNPQAGNIRCP